MSNGFAVKKNLEKALNAFLVAAIPSATLCLLDAQAKGETDMKKVEIAISFSVTIAGLKSLQNWLKNRNHGTTKPGS